MRPIVHIRCAVAVACLVVVPVTRAEDSSRPNALTVATAVRVVDSFMRIGTFL
jgi:hypothetical protein